MDGDDCDISHTFDDCTELSVEHDFGELDIFILDKFVNGKDLDCKFVSSRIDCVPVIMLLDDEDLHKYDSLLLLLFKSSSLGSVLSLSSNISFIFNIDSCDCSCE